MKLPKNTEYASLHGIDPSQAAGLRKLTRARSTGTLVGVYRSTDAGLDDDPEVPWMTVCEPHGYLVGHSTFKLAESFASAPEEWCEACQHVLDLGAAS